MVPHLGILEILVLAFLAGFIYLLGIYFFDKLFKYDMVNVLKNSIISFGPSRQQK
jgi:hypothetical protein